MHSGEILKILKNHTSSVYAVSFSPDGTRAISDSNDYPYSNSSDQTCILWDLKNGEIVARFISQSGVLAISYFLSGFFGIESSGKTFIMKARIDFLCPDRSQVTIRRIWDFESHRYIPFSADCPLCGHRFAPLASVIRTIESITKKAGLRPEQSPCLELPDEAWEDPGLLGNYPRCGSELKFNPFIAGGDL